MSYKPADFFVGVVDFFGVIMPGAIATYLLVTSVVLLSLCLWRYGERRWQSTQAAYAYLITHSVSPESRDASKSTKGESA